MVLVPNATHFLCKAGLLDTQGSLTEQKDAAEAAGSWNICLFMEPTAWGEHPPAEWSQPPPPLLYTRHSQEPLLIWEILPPSQRVVGYSLRLPVNLYKLSQALGWVLNLLEWPRYPRQVTLPT